MRPGWQRPAQPIGSQHGGHRHAVDPHQRIEHAYMLRRHGAHALEQRHARREVAALRGQRCNVRRQRGEDDGADVQRIGRPDAIPADRNTVGRVVDQARQRLYESRPGQRSEAAGGQARQNDASAQA